MGMLDRLFRRSEGPKDREVKGAAEADRIAADIQADETISAEAALQATVVLACVRVIAEGLMQVPFRLMRSDGTNREPATEHPLFRLFEDAPNELQTAPEFIEQIAMHAVLAGESIVWKNTVAGKVVELLPYDPKYVSVERKDWALKYTINHPDGMSQEIPASEIWHIRGPSWNGYRGLPGFRLAKEAIGLSLAAERHGAATFRNGAQISGILTTEQTLSAEQRKGLRESWQAVHGGSQNSGKIAVLSHGYGFQAMSSNNTDAQWLESRRFQIEEVCRAFRVMPIMVGYSDKAATYASAEQMFIAHVVHTLSPWYRRIEKSAAVNLLSEQDRANGLYFKFFANGLLRGAAKDRGEFYRSLYGIGALSPNEVRDLEDMNPYEGGAQYRVPLNMVDPAAEPAAPQPTGQ